MFLTAALLIIGLGVGAFSAAIGIGGGVIIVPLLILVFRTPPTTAIAASLLAITGTTLSASFEYIRRKQVNYRLAILYDIFDLPGVVVGANVTMLISSQALASICGLAVIAISLLILRRSFTDLTGKKGPPSPDGFCLDPLNADVAPTSPTTPRDVLVGKSIIYAAISSFAGGVMTGMAGMGGGVTDTTTMILLGVPVITAVASSEFAMALTNIMGVISHGLLGNFAFDLAIPLTIGTVIGAQFGCRIAVRVPRSAIRLALGITTLFFGSRLALAFLLPP